VDLLLLLVDSNLKLVDVSLLLSQLQLLVLNLASELFDLTFNFGEFISSDLKFGFRLKTHVGNLTEVVLVFLLNFLPFLVCVLLYLLHCFLIILHHLPDLSLELLNLVLLDLDEVVVVFLLLVDSGGVLLEQISLGSLVRARFFLLLTLQFLVLACIF